MNKAKKMGRRKFLVTATIATGGILAGCSMPQTPTQANPPTVTSEPPTLTPEPKKVIEGIVITLAYLTKQGAKITQILTDDSLNLAPQPTLIPTIKTQVIPDEKRPSKLLQSDIDYTKIHWGEEYFNRTSFDFTSGDTVRVLKLAVAKNSQYLVDQAVVKWENKGTPDDSSLFAGLSFYSEQMDITINSPDVRGEYQIVKGYPKDLGLVLKDKSRLTIVGRHKAANGVERIVVAFEEYLKRDDGTKFDPPRLYFAAFSPNEFGIITQKFLPNQEYSEGDDHFTFTDITTKKNVEVKFNTLSDDVLEALSDELNFMWVEKLKTANVDPKFQLFNVPKLGYPSAGKVDLPSGIDLSTLSYERVDDPKRLGDPESVKLQAKDTSGKVVLEAIYSDTDKRWEWKTPDESTRGKVFFKDSYGEKSANGFLTIGNTGTEKSFTEDPINPKENVRKFKIIGPAQNIIGFSNDTRGYTGYDSYKIPSGIKIHGAEVKVYLDTSNWNPTNGLSAFSCHGNNGAKVVGFNFKEPGRGTAYLHVQHETGAIQQINIVIQKGLMDRWVPLRFEFKGSEVVYLIDNKVVGKAVFTSPFTPDDIHAGILITSTDPKALETKINKSVLNKELRVEVPSDKS